MADLRDSLETALAKAVRHPGVFEDLLAGQARATVSAIDERRRNGQPVGPLAGELVSVKANIDVHGLITTGGSPALERAFLALAGTAARLDAPAPASRLAITSDYIWDECEPTVRDTVWSAIDRLAAHFHIEDIAVPEFHDLAALRHHGDFAAAESAAWARSIDLDTTLLGPLARARIERGDHLPAGDYLRALDERRRLSTRIDTRTQDVDAILMPTTSMLPPPFAGLTSQREAELNPRLLHTSRLANLLDRAAISLPAPGHPSVGLTLLAAQATDTALIRLAAQVQQILEF